MAFLAAAALAEAFLAGVLVAVRVTGFVVAGLAFVAATYTLSVVLAPGGRGRTSPKSSAMGNIGVIAYRMLAAVRLAAAGCHCNYKLSNRCTGAGETS
jgi:hypothetical protein